MGAPLRPVPYPVSFLDLPWAIFVEGAKVLKHVELSLNLLWPPSCVCPPSCCKTFKTDSKRTPRVGVSSGSLRYTPRTINQGPRPDHGVTVSTVTPRVAAALVVVWGACLGPGSVQDSVEDSVKDSVKGSVKDSAQGITSRLGLGVGGCSSSSLSLLLHALSSTSASAPAFPSILFIVRFCMYVIPHVVSAQKPADLTRSARPRPPRPCQS